MAKANISITGEDKFFEDKDGNVKKVKTYVKPKETLLQKIARRARFMWYWTTMGKAGKLPDLKAIKERAFKPRQYNDLHKAFVAKKLSQKHLTETVIKLIRFVLLRSQVNMFQHMKQNNILERAKAAWNFYKHILECISKDKYWWSDIHLATPAAARYMLENWCSLKDVPRYVRCLRYISKNLPRDWNLKVKSRNEFWFELINYGNSYGDSLKNRISKQRYSQLKAHVLSRKWKNMRSMSEYIQKKSGSSVFDECDYMDKIVERNGAFDDLCTCVFGREFKNKDIAESLAEEYLDHTKLSELKKSWKLFMYLLNPHINEDLRGCNHSIRSIANLATHFNHDDIMWLEKVKTGFKDDNMLIYWHDRWEMLKDLDRSRFSFLRRHDILREDLIKALSKIPMDVDLKGMTTSDIITLAGKYRYENVKNDQLAMIASECDMGQWQFENLQNEWIQNTNRLKQKNIPNVVVEDGAYKMYRLDHDDPRGLVLGEYTNCCQSIGSAGESCAKHGMHDRNGCFYVVEKDGKIVAQSWTWKSKKIVCFDNIEALSDDYMDTIAKLYKEVAKGLIEKGMEWVIVGAGHDDLGVEEHFVKSTTIVQPPAECYSDAKHSQFVIATLNP